MNETEVLKCAKVGDKIVLECGCKLELECLGKLSLPRDAWSTISNDCVSKTQSMDVKLARSFPADAFSRARCRYLESAGNSLKLNICCSSDLTESSYLYLSVPGTATYFVKRGSVSVLLHS